MRTLFAAIMLLLAFGARAEPAAEIRATYDRLVAAQNARDLAAVGAMFVDGPQFLWISNGQPYWGREATLRRMAAFQTAEVWRVEPALDRAVPVVLTPDSGFLHLPLDLVIGDAAAPNRYSFLVGVLCVRTPLGWRIAALFTTDLKTE